jgi:hypothetical protein
MVTNSLYNNYISVEFKVLKTVVKNVGSRTLHLLFVADLEKATAVLDGMKSEGRLY